MIGLRVKAKLQAKTLQRKVDDANFRSLGHAGGTIRKTAAYSIRRRKTPSRPGSPPHTQTGRLKQAIRYEVDRQTPGVVIGPRKIFSEAIWNLHEFGGVAAKLRPLKRHRFRVGQYGPIRQISSAKFVRIKLLTTAQANRATRLIEEENQRRASVKRGRYPARPFMRPALELHRSRLPKFWQDSVR